MNLQFFCKNIAKAAIKGDILNVKAKHQAVAEILPHFLLSSSKWTQSSFVNFRSCSSIYSMWQGGCQYIKALLRCPCFPFGDFSVKFVCNGWPITSKMWKTSFVWVGLLMPSSRLDKIYRRSEKIQFLKKLKMVENPIWQKLIPWCLLHLAWPKESKECEIVFPWQHVAELLL